MNYEISIIIPHYNSWEKLKRLLDSIGIKEQIQVIVVDDCSTNENDVFVCSEYSHVEFYKMPVNGGSGACRNYGLAHALGKWVLFADADDYFLDGFDETLRKYSNSGADIIFFIPTSIVEGEKRESNRHKDYKELIQNYEFLRDIVSENKLRYRFNPPWSKMIRKEMISENEICFEETRVSNDVMFSVRCGYYAKEIVTEEKTIYCITQGINSLTTKKDFNSIVVRLGEMVKTYRFLRARIPEKEIKQFERSK